MQRKLTYLLLMTAAGVVRASLADFSETTLAPESAAYGQTTTGPFVSAGLSFPNTYTDFGGGYFGWEGFALSNRTDTTTAGYGNQFSAYAGGGAGPGGSVLAGTNYAVSYAFTPARVTLPEGEGRPLSVYLTNTTYAALSMLNGDAFSKKFGGISGNDPDFLELTVTGLNATFSPTGAVTFALADYRFADNSLDHVVRDWTLLDLSPLGNNVRYLEFSMSGSDQGEFGLNTPTYFALDRLSVVPEPSALALGAGLLAVVIVASARRRK